MRLSKSTFDHVDTCLRLLRDFNRPKVGVSIRGVWFITVAIVIWNCTAEADNVDCSIIASLHTHSMCFTLC